MQDKTIAEARRWWQWGGFGLLGLHRWLYLGLYSGLLFPVFIIGGFGSAIEDGTGGTALVALIAVGWAIVDRWRLPTLVERSQKRSAPGDTEAQTRAYGLRMHTGEVAGSPQPGITVTITGPGSNDRLDPFQASYAGACAVCGQAISQGQMSYAREGWGASHTACGERAGWVTGDLEDVPRGEDLNVLSAKFNGRCKVYGYPIQQGMEIYAVSGYGAAHRLCEGAGWVRLG